MRSNNISVQAVLKRFALIYLPIIMVLSVALLTGIQHEEQIYVKEIEAREIAEVGSARVLVTRDLAAVDTDLRIFAKLPVLRLYLDSGNPAQREELEKISLVLAGEARRYDQVRYLDASGQEVIRINYNDGKPAIVPPASVTAHMEIPDALPVILVDPAQMHQVLWNLMTNAVEAMPGGGLLEIRAAADPPANTVTISIKDSGSGITPEQLDHLFEPLFTTKARRIGLGLVVVKNLTCANGGSIEVHSEVGKGTTFAITLPGDNAATGV